LKITALVSIRSEEQELQPKIRLVPVTRVDADVVVTITKALYEEQDELHRRTRYGSELQNVWSFIPRINHRLIVKKRNEEFQRLCWRLRTYYQPTLTFNILP
jgi:hypothetical protein